MCVCALIPITCLGLVLLLLLQPGSSEQGQDMEVSCAWGLLSLVGLLGSTSAQVWRTSSVASQFVYSTHTSPAHYRRIHAECAPSPLLMWVLPLCVCVVQTVPVALSGGTVLSPQGIQGTDVLHRRTGLKKALQGKRAHFCMLFPCVHSGASPCALPSCRMAALACLSLFMC